MTLKGIAFDLFHTLTGLESQWTTLPETSSVLGVDRGVVPSRRSLSLLEVFVGINESISALAHRASHADDANLVRLGVAPCIGWRLEEVGPGMLVGQDSVGLANIDDPTIVGWWMTPDEPDNAQQPWEGNNLGPPVTGNIPR